MLGAPVPLKRLYKLKVCLMGEESVGKSSTIRRLVHSDFSDKYTRTIGTTVSKRTISLEVHGDAVEADIILYDIVGDQRFIQLFKEAYFNKARGVIAVCDLTRPETLRALYGWLGELHKAVGFVPAVIFGNKADLEDRIRVTEEDLRALGGHFNAPILWTSAKTGQNVQQAFDRLTRTILGETLPVPAQSN